MGVSHSCSIGFQVASATSDSSDGASKSEVAASPTTCSLVASIESAMEVEHHAVCDARLPPSVRIWKDAPPPVRIWKDASAPSAADMSADKKSKEATYFTTLLVGEDDMIYGLTVNKLMVESPQATDDGGGVNVIRYRPLSTAKYSEWFKRRLFRLQTFEQKQGKMEHIMVPVQDNDGTIFSKRTLVKVDVRDGAGDAIECPQFGAEFFSKPGNENLTCSKSLKFVVVNFPELVQAESGAKTVESKAA
jgi:hypothetical protein